MHAVAQIYADNSTQAHFLEWAWGLGSWPTPTAYGLSSFFSAAGFIQTGNANVPSAVNVTSVVNTGNTSTPAGNFTTPSFNTATGDLMVLFVRWDRTATQNISTVTDLGGNTWNLVNTWNDGTPNTYVAAYYVQGATAHTGNTVTVTFSANVTFTAVVVYDASGVATTGALDASAAAYTSGSSEVTSLTPVISTTNANDMIFAFSDIDTTSSTITFPNGWIATGMLPTGGNFANAAYQGFTTVQTNLAVTSTFGVTQTGIAILLAFKQSPTAAAAPLGDGQIVFNNVTANITSTASSGSVATYGFSGLSGGPIRVGQYIASVSGTTNGSGAFNITIPSNLVVVTGVNYTSSTTGTFTTYWTGGTFTTLGETGTLQINSTCSTYFLTSTQTMQANNSPVGTTSNAAYISTFRGYWSGATTYSIGDTVLYVSSGTGTGAVMGVFVSLTNSNLNNAPPSTNAPNTNWAVFNYEIWQTGDSGLPAYVQGNSQSQTVIFNPLAFNAPNTAGNTLICFGRFTGGSGAPTIRDTNGNTWLQVMSVTNGSDINVIWAAYNVAGGTNTNYVTVAQPTQNALQMLVAEYSGVGFVSPQLDQSGDATGTSTAANSGNVTTTLANEIILGFVSNSTTNGLVITPGTGFTSRITVNGNTFLEDMTVTTTGSYSASATLSSSVPWFCAVVTLKGTQLPPYYFKIEYGNQSTNVPSLRWQLGTAITNSGSLSTSGLRGYRESVGYTSATTNSTTQYECDFWSDGVGGAFAIFMFRTAANNQQFFLGLERSKNNFGISINSYVTYVLGYPTTTWIQSSVFATGGINYGLRPTSGVATVFNQANATQQVGNMVPIAPLFPSVGYYGNPLTILVGLNLADTSEGTVFTASVYEANHNYLMSKGGGATFGEYFASTNQYSGFGMRWD